MKTQQELEKELQDIQKRQAEITLEANNLKLQNILEYYRTNYEGKVFLKEGKIFDSACKKYINLTRPSDFKIIQFNSSNYIEYTEETISIGYCEVKRKKDSYTDFSISYRKHRPNSDINTNQILFYTDPKSMSTNKVFEYVLELSKNTVQKHMIDAIACIYEERELPDPCKSPKYIHVDLPHIKINLQESYLVDKSIFLIEIGEDQFIYLVSQNSYKYLRDILTEKDRDLMNARSSIHDISNYISGVENRVRCLKTIIEEVEKVLNKK